MKRLIQDYLSLGQKIIRARRLPKESLERFFATVELFHSLYPTYHFKWPQLDWWENSPFNSYLQKSPSDESMNSERKWMLSQLVRLTCKVPGDTAECGVYEGWSSLLICLANEQSSFPRHHYCFDSFAGVSPPLERDGTFWKGGELAASYDEVVSRLSNYKECSVLKGWIPDRFGEINRNDFSFVHLDVDLYQPTYDSLAFFYPRLNTGGILLCDDYGFTTCPGATDAVDEYFQDKPESMIELASGGGFIIKGTAVDGSVFDHPDGAK